MSTTKLMLLSKSVSTWREYLVTHQPAQWAPRYSLYLDDHSGGTEPTSHSSKFNWIGRRVHGLSIRPTWQVSQSHLRLSNENSKLTTKLKNDLGT